MNKPEDNISAAQLLMFLILASALFITIWESWKLQDELEDNRIRIELHDGVTTHDQDTTRH